MHTVKVSSTSCPLAAKISRRRAHKSPAIFALLLRAREQNTVGCLLQLASSSFSSDDWLHLDHYHHRHHHLGDRLNMPACSAVKTAIILHHRRRSAIWVQLGRSSRDDDKGTLSVVVVIIFIARECTICSTALGTDWDDLGWEVVLSKGTPPRRQQRQCNWLV